MNSHRSLSLYYWFKFHNKRRNQEYKQNQKIILDSKHNSEHEIEKSRKGKNTDFNLILGI